ncbi:hypothetical protein [Aeromicrobium sp.]|uniref:hypothetical protein n=1 Tax=Aeromicrobium sp. TaxID=1871063 RepID=UPI0019CEAF19|nr:hypothetical protein [Aeromicrobium sp.]MBC7630700.1 hypothetical protein [Aeromicrobium sp.]
MRCLGCGTAGGDALLEFLALVLVGLVDADVDRVLDRPVSSVVDQRLPRLAERVGEVEVIPQVDEEGAVDPRPPLARP